MLHCRFCKTPLEHTFVNLGSSPPCESFLKEEQLHQGETFYPLHVRVCAKCLLVQIPECLPATEIFDDYAYFSSFSDSWLAHASDYCAAMTERFELNQDSFAVELASNDGYLLRNFVKAGIPCLGIEPSGNVAEAAKKVGVESLVQFFGIKTAGEVRKQRGPADLITANNVLAHVPDINDFVGGAAHLLAPTGVITYEFPHLSRLIEECQYDTIYHEHLCYFSLTALDRLFRSHGLEIVHVERLDIHGGSIRIHAMPLGAEPVRDSVKALLAEEAEWVDDAASYASFGTRVENLRKDLVGLLAQLKSENKRVAVYGASAKGSTLLNFFGIGKDQIDYVVDRSTVKQGHFTPGTHLRIYDPDRLTEDQPDYCLLLTWNFADEILQQQKNYRDQGGKFIIPIPDVRVA